MNIKSRRFILFGLGLQPAWDSFLQVSVTTQCDVSERPWPRARAPKHSSCSLLALPMAWDKTHILSQAPRASPPCLAESCWSFSWMLLGDKEPTIPGNSSKGANLPTGEPQPRHKLELEALKGVSIVEMGSTVLRK